MRREWEQVFRAAAMAALCSALTVVCGCREKQHTTLTLSVAASVQDAIVEVETAYKQDHADTEFRNNFGSSGTLAQQIQTGAPVDAFLSAGAKPMDQLETAGLLQQGTRENLLHNTLVLIAPQGSGLQGFDGLPGKQVRLVALGDPASVPAGDYGKQTLTSLGLYDKISSKLVLGKDVRQVLSYVETGNADAGLVYATDAQISTKVRVVAVAPEPSHKPIVYPLAEIRTSTQDAAVRAFLAFLNTPAAKAIFVRHGFTIA
jgi:molybdate transport system substrate-binding protein